MYLSLLFEYLCCFLIIRMTKYLWKTQSLNEILQKIAKILWCIRLLWSVQVPSYNNINEYLLQTLPLHVSINPKHILSCKLYKHRKRFFPSVHFYHLYAWYYFVHQPHSFVSPRGCFWSIFWRFLSQPSLNWNFCLLKYFGTHFYTYTPCFN